MLQFLLRSNLDANKYLAFELKQRSNKLSVYNDFGGQLDFGASVIPGNIYYVDGWNGSDTNNGLSWDSAFKTMAAAFAVLASNDTVFLKGRITEQLTAPLGVFDVKIIGASTRPRHGTNNGVQAGFASHWKYATDNTTPNLILREQGWVVANILWEPPTSGAAIRLHRAESATFPDASHAQFLGNIFIGGGTGIEDIGGMYNCLIEGNRFAALTNGIKTISTGIAVPLRNAIRGNQFDQNTNDILMSSSYGEFSGNRFFGATVCLNTKYVSSQGDHNMVFDNDFNLSSTDFANGVKVVGAATDMWNNNRNNDTVAVEVGVPAP